MVAAMGYIEEAVQTNEPRRISTILEKVYIKGIMEDSPITESSLPTEEYTGYTRTCGKSCP